ncbi:MAG: creatininase family protein [Acidobacteriota bacterium]|nr:creatininase family protein [Acidobacteriota bacterium]MDE3031082.1 creatininase family protein [Acidobacteriota bacterium]MDE3094149.1 creatininase family protein [Acidobacteriota bacterium]MDE3147564.1 creatininase family protein [Acidobacteriota bacterium]
MVESQRGRGVRFDELTNPEIVAALSERPLVLIPCGSTEQHGPHLPTGTDYFASLAVCDLVATSIGGLVLGGMQFGITPIHMGFPSTVTVSAATFEAIHLDIAASLVAHGVTEIAYVNWHEGNIGSLTTIASRVTQELKANVVVAQACYVAEEHFGERMAGLTHGGAIEAAAVLGYRPELVRYDQLDPAEDSPGERPADHARRGRSFQTVLRDIREISDSGWYGSSQRVSDDEGRELVARVAEVVAGELDARFAHLKKIRTDVG